MEKLVAGDELTNPGDHYDESRHTLRFAFFNDLDISLFRLCQHEKYFHPLYDIPVG